jgi:UDP-N-acetyl-alpha-D-muramoyl-L-alanyl-L-glutamate epimerase
MIRSNRESTFFKLREQFPYFTFEKQEYELTTRGLHITYTFNLANQYIFHPDLFIPRKSFFLADEILTGHLDNIVFNIGMIELISYWKAACSQLVIIRPFALQDEQVAWWKKVYYHGLGEFFYLNSIPVTPDDFMQIVNDGNCQVEMHRGATQQVDSVIIPVGGGKDSAVTLEMLGSRPGCLPLIINPRGASLDTIAAKGFSPDQLIDIQRIIDPELLRLNDLGFLNGHTPFSAMLAFVTILAAMVTGRRHIALSNESSANEETIEGTGINHQYSKSLQFEVDFRDYVKKWISGDINYFSFLRPLNELQIASLFSRYQQYHPIFKSCNAGSKTNSWCGVCAKCLFTYVILSPFLPPDQLVRIFGKDLLADETLQPLLDQLTGSADEKPFDCVGTVNEVNLALCEIIRQRKGSELPCLLETYRNSHGYSKFVQVDFASDLLRHGGGHHLVPEFLEILEEQADKRTSGQVSG